MKKLLLGLLIVGALSACTSSEEKMNMQMEVQTLNKTVATQKNDYEMFKAEAKDLEDQMHALRDQINDTRDEKNN
jgi:septal ring factor EnvC (AmiA/AmiB activator)